MNAWVYDIALTTRFRGIDRRQGMIWRGEAGWGEWSPFLDYSGAEIVPWLAAAREAADVGFPKPVRDFVPVNCTIPAVDPETAFRMTAESGCSTAKVKVAERGQAIADDLARVEAVRHALGPTGKLRLDANGGWDVDAAEQHLTQLARFDLEYVEQPCLDVTELAALRVRLAKSGRNIRIAADESIRRSGDPERVARLEAADVAVLKVQPLGGVRRCLELAETLRLPVVVSSALETSIGLAAGVALAAALPELEFACGLNTMPLLSDDVGLPVVRAEAGQIRVQDVVADLDALERVAADADGREFWAKRLAETELLAAELGD